MPLAKSEEKLLIHDFRIKLVWGVRIRYAILVAGLFLLFGSYLSGINMDLGFRLILFLALYNLLAHVLFIAKKRFQLWQIISFISACQLLDLLAITFLIYITGWVESPYWFLYLILIVVSGFGIFSQYSTIVFLIAMFSMAFYLGLLLSTYFGLIPTYGPGFTVTSQELLVLIVNRSLFTVISFFLFAGTIYYFSKMLTQNRDALSAKNRELLATLSRLKDIDRLKDEFVSTASHELRTPLAVVRENMSLIKDGVAGPVSEKQNKLLSSSCENIDRLAQIINNLLDISKIESRSLELNRQPVDIGLIAGKAVNMLKDLAGIKKIAIESRLTEGAATLADADYILRVFINLLDNAIKYTDENGTVTVGVEIQNDQIMSFVKDNGIGIAEDDLSLLFERFVQLNHDDRMKKKGAGLGLSICRGIVEMHGGKIWAESREGEGSKFIFTLPKVGTNE